MALGVGQLLLWCLGLGFLMLLTCALPGALLRALVRAPLLMGLVLLMVPRWFAGGWSWRSAALGLLAAAVSAWLIEYRWNDPDDSVDLSDD